MNPSNLKKEHGLPSFVIECLEQVESGHIENVDWVFDRIKLALKGISTCKGIYVDRWRYAMQRYWINVWDKFVNELVLLGIKVDRSKKNAPKIDRRKKTKGRNSRKSS